MIPLTGNVSLLAVRDDLDLTGNFSLRKDVAGKNKATWDSTTNLSLTEYRGNVLGQQYDKQTKGATRSRHEFEEGNFLHNGSLGSSKTEGIPAGADSTTVFPDKPKSTQCIHVKCARSTYTDDTGNEARHFGFITESGSYLLQLFVNKFNETGQAEPYSKISVIANSAGYLSGLSTTVLDDNWGYGNRWQKYEKTITLDVASPYVTVIVYAINKGQGTQLRSAECYYSALQLDKI